MTKLYLDIDEIKERPNDMTLGSYVREKSFNMENTMNTKKDIENHDLVVEIMKDWYYAMDQHGISVQPKASTILGTVLAKHLNNGEEDVFDRYMNTKGGEFDAFWKSLSNDEKAYVEKRRQEMRDEYYAKRNLVDEYKTKVLLKG